jgi:hypothetical protein
MKTIILLVFIAFISACSNKVNDTQPREQEKTESFFGVKKITQEGAISLTEVLSKLEKKEGLEEITLDEGIKVKGLRCKTSGKITDMCQMSGCWFIFKTEDNKELFVQMKDHKPTPKEWSGKTVVVEGLTYLEEIGIEELRLKAKEEGASRDELSKIIKSEIKYNFIADGAILKD